MTLAIYRLWKRLVPDGAGAGEGVAVEGGSAGGGSSDGGTECGCRDEKDTRVVEECLDSILKEVEVLKNLAQEFSSFAKMPEPTLKPTDLNETVRSILDLYVPTFERLELVTSYAEGLPHVEADADQLRRVIGNIVKNAAEAIGLPT